MTSANSEWVTEDWKTPDGKPQGASFSMKVKEVLYDSWTGLQHLWIGETENFGRVMLLDGFVMLTEHDEFVYHEMLTHVPLCSHPQPKDVLVIGGGDGGTIREVLKHSCVETVTLCEIDGEVIEASRRFLPSVHAGAFDSSRSRVHVGDGLAFVNKALDESFDVLLIDSTDPVGPGEALFSSAFYQNCARVLKPGGILALQSEGPFKDPQLFTDIQSRVRAGVNNSHPYLAFIPSYPTGMWSLTMATREATNPGFDAARSRIIAQESRYYTPEIHQAAFRLPAFVQKLMP